MAGGISENGGGRRRGRFRRHQPMAEINVTPMVDVMLVLLVIFMVTAPMLTVGVHVDLPETRKSSELERQQDPLTVTVKANGTLYLNDSPVPDETDLVPRLLALVGTDSERRVFVRGDTNAVYGRVLKVMGDLKAAGFERVALVTRLPKSEGAR